MKVAVSTEKPSKLEKPLKKSSSRLLYLVIKKHGGISHLGRHLGVDRRLIFYWIKTGHVPMSRLGEVSRILQVDKYALNFEGMVKLEEKEKSWELLVEYYIKNDRKLNWVLAGAYPHTYDELIA